MVGGHDASTCPPAGAEPKPWVDGTTADLLAQLESQPINLALAHGAVANGPRIDRGYKANNQGQVLVQHLPLASGAQQLHQQTTTVGQAGAKNVGAPSPGVGSSSSPATNGGPRPPATPANLSPPTQNGNQEAFDVSRMLAGGNTAQNHSEHLIEMPIGRGAHQQPDAGLICTFENSQYNVNAGAKRASCDVVEAMIGNKPATMYNPMPQPQTNAPVFLSTMGSNVGNGQTNPGHLVSMHGLLHSQPVTSGQFNSNSAYAGMITSHTNSSVRYSTVPGRTTVDSGAINAYGQLVTSMPEMPNGFVGNMPRHQNEMQLATLRGQPVYQTNGSNNMFMGSVLTSQQLLTPTQGHMAVQTQQAQRAQPMYVTPGMVDLNMCSPLLPNTYYNSNNALYNTMPRPSLDDEVDRKPSNASSRSNQQLGDAQNLAVLGGQANRRLGAGTRPQRAKRAKRAAAASDDDDDDEYVAGSDAEGAEDASESEDDSMSTTSRRRARGGKTKRSRGGGKAAGSGRGRNKAGKANDGGADAPKTRSSQYRGVTRHRRSGRWEAHIWVKDIGRQVYLGGYENEEHAAEAYDVAALKTKGVGVATNFPVERYSDLLDCMDNITLEELIMAVRRQSQGFSRGSSCYRGVTAHPTGRWESRIGIPGSKHVYLGLFEDQEAAACAYDRALVRLRGTAAATNFALSDYRRELAEYHQAQQAVLLQDSRIEEVMKGGPEFEKWVKHGSAAFAFLAEAMAAANPLLEEGGPATPTPITGVAQDMGIRSMQNARMPVPPSATAGAVIGGKTESPFGLAPNPGANTANVQQAETAAPATGGSRNAKSNSAAAVPRSMSASQSVFLAAANAMQTPQPPGNEAQQQPTATPIARSLTTPGGSIATPENNSNSNKDNSSSNSNNNKEDNKSEKQPQEKENAVPVVTGDKALETKEAEKEKSDQPVTNNDDKAAEEK